MLKGIITVTLQPAVLDVQGQAVCTSLHHLGFDNVQSVRIGRHVEVNLPDMDHATAEAQLKMMCDKLLANPVIEDYRFEIVEA